MSQKCGLVAIVGCPELNVEIAPSFKLLGEK